jgi:hypothetical protein
LGDGSTKKSMFVSDPEKTNPANKQLIQHALNQSVVTVIKQANDFEQMRAVTRQENVRRSQTRKFV